MSDERKGNPRALGLRAQAEKVSVAILEGSQEEPVMVERHTLEAPTGSAMPEVLASIRSQLVDLIKSHDVERIGIRLPEPTARSNKEGARNRTRLDGVLLEIAQVSALSLLATYSALFEGSINGG
jgi:predicted NBD/HSP70 family sugar kinase